MFAVKKELREQQRRVLKKFQNTDCVEHAALRNFT